ncbi:MAG TPA: histidinol-phosphate transaminase [Thermoleophilia bacterium]|nr:histidinol-phosphate transaminase [Thermoleophilia bacterium]
MRFVSSLDRIVPYEPGAPIESVMRRFGLDTVVKLASNESPLPPFQAVKRAVTEALADLNRYPDGSCVDLRAALAEHYDRDPGGVAVGNGSCELLLLLADVMLEPDDEVVIADPSFLVYADTCATHAARAVRVPLRDLTHDLDAMACAVGPQTRMLIVCNPNNPTGTYVPADAIAHLVERVPDDVLVVLDEAYNEFVTAPDSQDTLAIEREHDNVCILRTFSKIYGLCGLRVGYGLCSPEVKTALDKVRQPFNVNHLAQVAAMEALKHQDEVAERQRFNAEARAYLAGRLQDMGRAVALSEANFMLVDMRDLCPPDVAVCRRLLELGAIVRDGNQLGCPGWARVSVGTRDEIDFFLEKLSVVAGAEGGR